MNPERARDSNKALKHCHSGKYELCGRSATYHNTSESAQKGATSSSAAVKATGDVLYVPAIQNFLKKNASDVSGIHFPDADTFYLIFILLIVIYFIARFLRLLS